MGTGRGSGTPPAGSQGSGSVSFSERYAPPKPPRWRRVFSVETAQSKLDCSVLAKLEGKKIMVGCLDLNDMAVESPETVVARIKRALPYVKAENVILAPDSGMKYLPRDVALGKMKSMVDAAKMLRTELGS